MALKSLRLMVQRLRSKAFSPVCLSRFLEFLPLIPHYVTASKLRRTGTKGGEEFGCKGRIILWEC
jgi:hypothetical protein